MSMIYERIAEIGCDWREEMDVLASDVVKTCDLWNDEIWFIHISHNRSA